MNSNHFIAIGVVVCIAFISPAFADIYEWEYVDPADPSAGRVESTTPCPDGVGVDAASGVNLDDRNLTQAYLVGAHLHYASLLRVDFTRADLTNADISTTAIKDTIFTDAIINGAHLPGTGNNGYGLKPEMIYSTASYQQGDLTGISFGDQWLHGQTWDFSGQNLSSASFAGTDMYGVDFSNANLSGASFREANLNTGSLVGADLTGANFRDAYLGVDITGAIIRGADFSYTWDFFASDLYSTASYQEGDLSGITILRVMDHWDLSGIKFTGATFTSAELNYTDCSGSDFYGANFGHAELYSANFTGSRLADVDFFLFGNGTAVGLDSATLTGADMRGCSDVPNVSSRNLVHRDGHVDGFTLLANESQRIWDYNGGIGILVQQGFFLPPSGELQMWFEDDAWGSTMAFESGIDVELAGTLRLDFWLSQLTPELGLTFDLFDWDGANVTGSFDAVETNMGLETGLWWDTSQLYTTGEVTLVPEPATMSLLALGGVAMLKRRRVCR